MNKELVASINGQINFEIYSSYLYLAMASYFKSLNLNGFANWMNVQTKEELSHAMKLYNFLHDRGEEVELEAIAKPELKWDSPLVAFETAYAHEQIVSMRINDMVSEAVEANDHATVNFLQWFVAEQVEEEANAMDVVQQIKLVGKALFMLDRELGQRVFVDSTADANQA
jgi:ferritin